MSYTSHKKAAAFLKALYEANYDDKTRAHKRRKTQPIEELGSSSPSRWSAKSSSSTAPFGAVLNVRS